MLTDEYKEIQNVAKEIGLVLKEPNQSCKKCFGRGWIGKDSNTGNPIPCKCIFKEAIGEREIGEFHYKARNRQERREQHKNIKRNG